MNKEIINWMLTGPSWLQYAVKLQLLNTTPDISLAFQDVSIKKLVDRLKSPQIGFSGLKTGKVYYTKTGNVYWDLFFLADIGFTLNDLQLDEQVENIFNLQSEDGKFVTQDNIKPDYFCIPSILLASLAKMGYKRDQRFNKYLQIILEAQRRDAGWHCAKSRAIGQKLENSESCPMDNLNVLMLFGQFDEYKSDARFNGAIDLLLTHWVKKEEKWRPYGFGIGAQFMKLKYPAVKYGILRVLDVLSMFPYAMNDNKFKDMLDFVQQKTVDGKYFAESIVKSYAEFDFGQKKEPSKWITFLINRIEKRVSKYLKECSSE